MKRAYLAGGRSKEADRISELPDNIIHEILERLKYSQITLALSRRWMQIWLSYPILEFHCDDESFDYSAKLKLFLAAAARKLSSSQHSRIKALRISSKYVL
ncbi:FBD-associated F-box protein At5g27750 [Linum perenne]